MPVPRIQRTVRNIKRYGEIIDVLVRHGFEDIVAELRLDRLLEKGRRLIPGAGPRAPHTHLSRAARLRRAMEDLGPTFMKLGQVLSVRPDLIPEEWAEEFKALQANGPRLPFAVVRQRLDEEFPGRVEEIFASIDPEPLAAASMAQVHRATLADGTPVVIKVLRPGTEEVTQSDMEVLETLAQFAENHFSNLGYSPREVVREFARELKREVDLTHEGRSTDRLRNYFAENPAVRFPVVYWRATTRGVLALEEFRGVLLSTLTNGELTGQQRRDVVAHGADAVLRQCLELGFFHADPHPGNLFALPDACGGAAVGFIDCGMTGQIEPRTTEALAHLVLGVVHNDLERVVTVVGQLADAEPAKLEDRAFRSDVAEFIAHFEGATLAQINMAALLNEFFAKLRAHEVKCPADLVLLIKALSTIESVGRDLDPAFDMVAYARPYVERLVHKRVGVRALRRRFRDSLAAYAVLAEDLPGEIRTLLTQVRKNRLAINLEHRGLTRLTQTIEHASRNIGFSLLICGVLVGSSILIHADRDGRSLGLKPLGIIGFVGAGVLTVLHVLANRRWLKEKRRGP